mmetsp:Transcript_68931/g.183636  ORF Transcript_68931/g.183636 Transcript_68931/m.183636 type:complete len:169 (-) Transcript_68931:67-573(-)
MLTPQQVADIAASSAFTEDQIEEFFEAFLLFDVDRGGSISAEELGAVMQSLGRDPQPGELEAMIAEVDDDGSGEIEFPEFIQLLENKIDKNDCVGEYREAFSFFDKDGGGTIDAEELMHVMITLGRQVSSEQVHRMIQEADADGDGELSFDDFLQFASNRGLLRMAGD